MNGKIHSIPSKDGVMRNFCFIKGDDGKDYFLHESELFEKWHDLKLMLAKNAAVSVVFEFTETEKGRRAVGCQLLGD